MNGFLGGCAVILPRRFAPTEQPGIVQIGMFRRVQTGAGRVFRSGPSFAMVVKVAEYIKMFLPAGWAWVERLAAG